MSQITSFIAMKYFCLCQIAAKGQTASVRYVKSVSCNDRRPPTLHLSISRIPDILGHTLGVTDIQNV